MWCFCEESYIISKSQVSQGFTIYIYTIRQFCFPEYIFDCRCKQLWRDLLNPLNYCLNSSRTKHIDNLQMNWGGGGGGVLLSILLVKYRCARKTRLSWSWRLFPSPCKKKYLIFIHLFYAIKHSLFIINIKFFFFLLLQPLLAQTPKQSRHQRGAGLDPSVVFKTPSCTPAAGLKGLPPHHHLSQLCTPSRARGAVLPVGTPLRTPKSVRRGPEPAPTAVEDGCSQERILGTPDYLAPEILLQQQHGTLLFLCRSGCLNQLKLV